MMENSAIRKSIACLIAGGSLSESEAAAAMHDVMENKATSAQ